MASNAYHFITHWRVKGTVEEVSDILADPRDLMRWWPAVYLNAEILEKGNEQGVGKVVSLYTKGWLPYTLRWSFRVTEASKDGFTIVAWGDFEGRGIWTFEQDGPWVNIVYDWKILAEKPLLRYFSFVMKPIFAANHRWAMAKGEESLHLELARLHASTKEELDLIAASPQPTSRVPFVIGTAAFVSLGGIFYRVMRTASKRRG